jgi:hypothetical protein
MEHTIDFSADIVNLDEITDRVDALRESTSDYENEEGNLEAHDAWVNDKAELVALEGLLEDIKGYGGDHQWEGDWYPGYLIARDHFVAYIEELIDDCYEMPKEMKSGAWPWRHVSIDYEAAAKEAEQDYTSIDFDGREFLYR